jgi:hypothetical protein
MLDWQAIEIAKHAIFGTFAGMKTVFVLSLMLLLPLFAIAGERDFLSQGVFYKDTKLISVEGDKATIQVAGQTPGTTKTAVVPVASLPAIVKTEGAAIIAAAKQREEAMAKAAASASGGAPNAVVRLTGKILEVKGMSLIVQCEAKKESAIGSLSSLNKNTVAQKNTAGLNRPQMVTGVFVIDGHPNALTKQKGNIIDVDAVKLPTTADMNGQVYPRYKIMRVVE